MNKSRGNYTSRAMIHPRLGELRLTLDEMLTFPRGSVYYVILKIHTAALLDKFLDEATDEQVEELWRRLNRE